MATAEIIRPAIWLDAYDLRRGANQAAIDASSDALDATCFADLNRVKLLDAPAVAISVSGYMTDDFDVGLFDTWGDQGLALTLAKSKTAAALAFVGGGTNGAYRTGMARGQVRTFALASEIDTTGFGRGRLMHVGTAVAATGNGAGQQLRGISAGAFALANLHVTAVSGVTPSLTVTVQGDDNAGFTSPTTRAAFTARTAIGAQTIRIDGPVTDDWWRAIFTVSGTTPAFDFAVALGFSEGI